jgi:hypothetical protein
MAKCHFVAMGQWKLEVTALNDRVTVVFYQCSLLVLGLLCTIPKLFVIFFSGVNDRRLLISTARGRARPEVALPFDSSSMVFSWSSLHNTCLTCTDSQIFVTFLIVNYGGISISTT